MRLDGDPRGKMFELNTVVGFVHFLSAFTAATDKAFFEVSIANAELLKLLFEEFNFGWPNGEVPIQIRVRVLVKADALTMTPLG